MQTALYTKSMAFSFNFNFILMFVAAGLFKQRRRDKRPNEISFIMRNI